MKRAVPEQVYPELRFGGFTRYDGTIAFFSRVQALLGEKDTVLDIGCGRGKRKDDPSSYRRRLQDLRGPQRRVIGIDVDEQAAENPYIDSFRRIEDISRWPIDDASVDLAISDYVLEHVEEPDEFFREAHRALKPGGVICLRTPNSWSYIALMARIIPNKLHAKVTGYAQTARQSRDVFPTVYRCNTRGRINRMLRKHGFDGHVLANESEPGYLSFSRLAYRIGTGLHPMLPSPLRSTLLAFARKQ